MPIHASWILCVQDKLFVSTDHVGVILTEEACPGRKASAAAAYTANTSAHWSNNGRDSSVCGPQNDKKRTASHRCRTRGHDDSRSGAWREGEGRDRFQWGIRLVET